MIFMPFPRFVTPISAPPPLAITNVASMKHSSSSSAPLSRSSLATVVRLHVDRPRRRPARGGGRVGVGERSGDGAWRWSFLDSAIGRGAVAAPHKRPPVRWPGGGWQSESARIERVRRPKFSGGWPVYGRPHLGPGTALGSRSRDCYRCGSHTWRLVYSGRDRLPTAPSALRV